MPGIRQNQYPVQPLFEYILIVQVSDMNVVTNVIKCIEEIQLHGLWKWFSTRVWEFLINITFSVFILGTPINRFEYYFACNFNGALDWLSLVLFCIMFKLFGLAGWCLVVISSFLNTNFFLLFRLCGIFILVCALPLDEGPGSCSILVTKDYLEQCNVFAVLYDCTYIYSLSQYTTYTNFIKTQFFIIPFFCVLPYILHFIFIRTIC